MTVIPENSEETAFDPEGRQLCPDDTCIGVIGPDGRCKVCGARAPQATVPEGQPAAPSGAPEHAGRQEDESPADSAPDPEGFDPDSRVLCADDTCTGLIGPDGTCKVCGKPYVEPPRENLE